MDDFQKAMIDTVRDARVDLDESLTMFVDSLTSRDGGLIHDRGFDVLHCALNVIATPPAAMVVAGGRQSSIDSANTVSVALKDMRKALDLAPTGGHSKDVLDYILRVENTALRVAEICHVASMAHMIVDRGVKESDL